MAGSKTIELPEIGSPNSTADAKVRNALNNLLTYHNALLTSENKLDFSESGLKWYTPKLINTEETRENSSFGYSTTADKIENVVLNSNGIINIMFYGLFKSSGAGTGRAGLFLGENQAKLLLGTAVEASTQGTNEFTIMRTTAETLGRTETGVLTSIATGATLTALSIIAPAGTYTVGIKYKATSGSITVKERLLRVWTLG